MTIHVFEDLKKLQSVDKISEITDGNHTFDELYDHRCLLFLLVMDAHPNESWFSHKHSDGEVWDGWFICGTELPTGSITYHLPVSMYDLAKGTGALELTAGKPWDGHTSKDVISRLTDYLKMGTS